MHKDITSKLESKLKEIAKRRYTICEIAAKTSTESASIATGMLYNSFYYQTKKISGHTPTADDLAEFIEFLQSNKELIVRLLII